MQALRPYNGRVVWEEPRAERERVTFPAGILAPVVVSSVGISARHALTGSVAWQQTLGNVTFASVLGAQGVLAVGASDGTLLGLDPRTGARRWTWPFGDAPLLCCDDGPLLAASGGTVRALRPADGTPRWITSFAMAATDLHVLDDGAGAATVLVTTRGGTIVALNATTGTRRWTASPGSVGASLASQGVVAATVADGVVGLDLATGRVRWRVHTGDRPQLVGFDSTGLAMVAAGNLVAIDPPGR